MRERVALSVFLALGVGLMVFGSIYLAASEFMPYHSDAIQTEWADLESHAQGLFLGFMKGLGGGALIAGLAVTAMAWSSLRAAVSPYAILLPLVCTGYFSLLGYAIITVRKLTPATPPLYIVLTGVVFSLLASVLLWVGERTSE